MEYSTAEYIRWVKASINHHVGSKMRDDGSDTPEYRQWIRTFQGRYAIPQTGNVDKQTQDKLIWLNHADPRYVQWAAQSLHDYMARHNEKFWTQRLNELVKECQMLMGCTVDGGWIGPQVEWGLRNYKLPLTKRRRPGLEP